MIEYRNHGATTTVNVYAEQIRKILQEIEKNDEESSQKKGTQVCVAMSTIEDAGFEIIAHPPYSLNLAISDFHLFPRLKDRLRGTKFEDDEGVKLLLMIFHATKMKIFFHKEFSL